MTRAYPGPDLQGLGGHRRRRQCDERVHHVVVLLAELAAASRRRLAGARNVRVLGRPDELETARLQRLAELGRGHRVIGEEHRRAKIHHPSPVPVMVQAYPLSLTSGQHHFIGCETTTIDSSSKLLSAVSAASLQRDLSFRLKLGPVAPVRRIQRDYGDFIFDRGKGGEAHAQSTRRRGSPNSSPARCGWR